MGDRWTAATGNHIGDEGCRFCTLQSVVWLRHRPPSSNLPREHTVSTASTSSRAPPPGLDQVIYLHVRLQRPPTKYSGGPGKGKPVQ